MPRAFPLHAACACGAVRLTVRGGRLDVAHCLCRMCQRYNAAPVVTWVTVDIDATAIEGELRWVRSSEHAERGFCPTCGTHLVFRLLDPSSRRFDLTVAAFEDPDALVPTYRIWEMSKPAWLTVDPHLPGYENAGPDAPAGDER